MSSVVSCRVLTQCPLIVGFSVSSLFSHCRVLSVLSVISCRVLSVLSVLGFSVSSHCRVLSVLSCRVLSVLSVLEFSVSSHVGFSVPSMFVLTL